MYGFDIILLLGTILKLWLYCFSVWKYKCKHCWLYVLNMDSRSSCCQGIPIKYLQLQLKKLANKSIRQQKYMHPKIFSTLRLFNYLWYNINICRQFQTQFSKFIILACLYLWIVLILDKSKNIPLNFLLKKSSTTTVLCTHTHTHKATTVYSLQFTGNELRWADCQLRRQRSNGELKVCHKSGGGWLLILDKKEPVISLPNLFVFWDTLQPNFHSAVMVLHNIVICNSVICQCMHLCLILVMLFSVISILEGLITEMQCM